MIKNYIPTPLSVEVPEHVEPPAPEEGLSPGLVEPSVRLEVVPDDQLVGPVAKWGVGRDLAIADFVAHKFDVFFHTEYLLGEMLY